VSEADHSAWPVQSIFGNQNLSAQWHTPSVPK
jgi:hypothetical protein